MISKIVGQSINKQCRYPSFQGNENARQVPEPNAADKFIAAVDSIAKKEQHGGFMSKYMWSPTAFFTGAALPCIYESITLIKARRLKLGGSTPELKALLKHFKRNLALLIIGGIGVMEGLQCYFNSQTDKNIKNFRKTFDKINTKSSAELDDKTFRSTYKGAFCNSLNGKVSVNRNLINDPIFATRLKGLIKHELVHAGQFETIARSEDGIKKLNDASVAKVANIAKSSYETKKEFEEIYKAVSEDTIGKYDKVTIKLSGADVNFKNYINAIHILLNDEKAGYNDIPMILDMSHYDNIIKEKGKLSTEEEQKADMYYEALLQYSDITPINALNPFGSYRSNILEKEAYKENQSWFMNIFNK